MIDVSAPHAPQLTCTRIAVSHGVTIGLRTNDPGLLERASTCLPTGWTESATASADVWYGVAITTVADGRRTLYRLYEGEAQLEQGFRVTPILERLESTARIYVGRRSPDRLFIHAGAVAWNGRCIVLPGGSGAGKTTLVTALVRAGATYLSDEYAVIDANGWVHPYARPLAVKRGDHRRVQRHAASDLGGETAQHALPIGMVISTRYRPLANWAPQTISSGAVALALLANTLAARERPRDALSIFARALPGVVALEGDRGEAEAAAAAILDYAAQIADPPSRGPVT